MFALKIAPSPHFDFAPVSNTNSEYSENVLRLQSVKFYNATTIVVKNICTYDNCRTPLPL